MTPNLGQGAVISMEDAMELAELIASKTTSPAAALARLRHKRVSRVHRQSRMFGNIAHSDSRLAKGLKSLVFRALPMRRGVASQVAWMDTFKQRLNS